MTRVQVDQDQLVADLTAMVQCSSVNPFGAETTPGAEAAMADLFETQLRDIGLETDSKMVLPGRRNVWGRINGPKDGPRLLLAGHLDTVGVDGYDAPFEARIENGRMYGRGACDMKAGLAAYLQVARHFVAHPEHLPGDLIVAGLVDEEYAMAGSVDFGASGPTADFAIVAEPSELQVCPVHKGQILVSLTTQGLATHSSVPSNGINAIYHMAKLIDAFRQYADDLANRPPDPLCGPPTFSIGVVQGGTDACSVPDRCRIDLDRRLIPGETAGHALQELRDVVDQVAAQNPQMQAQFGEPFLMQDPLQTAQDGPLVQTLTQACASVTGTSDIAAFPGSTDAPNLGCTAVICGPGALAQCHSLNEYVALDQVVQAVQIYATAIQNFQTVQGI
ncbi:MAG: M20 family metallopeptidase, partial [Pseudomonadota bacterium]